MLFKKEKNKKNLNLCKLGGKCDMEGYTISRKEEERYKEGKQKE
jgi:hypothetical protein